MRVSEEVFSLDLRNISWNCSELMAPRIGGREAVAGVVLRASKKAAISGVRSYSVVSEPSRIFSVSGLSPCAFRIVVRGGHVLMPSSLAVC